MRMIAMCAWRKSVHGGAEHGARHGCVAAACLRGKGAREGTETARGENWRKGMEGERHGARGATAAAVVVAARGELAWHPFTGEGGGAQEGDDEAAEGKERPLCSRLVGSDA